MRWGAAVKKLVELIESGEAGRPVLFSGQYECNSLHTPWWRNVNLSGGQLFEQAIHLYDICRYLVAHPKSVTGIMSNTCHGHLHDYTVEDVSASIASFTNGAVASITANNCAVAGKWLEKFSVIYENVSVFFENPNKATFAFTKGNEVKYETIDELWDLKYEEVKDFISAVNVGERNISCDFKEGYLSLCYVEAVIKSAKMDNVKTMVKSL
jgi:predicted dehydrogenase